MKIIIGILFCLFFAISIFAQVETENKTNAVGVEDIILFKDDGTGKKGDETENFSTSDKTLHCQILLDSEKAVTVKMEMVAVEVKGAKAGAKTVVISYKTNGKQNVVNFNFKPQIAWNAGKYKINVLIDGKQTASKEFEITAPEIKKK